jgi:hypothetical protein
MSRLSLALAFRGRILCPLEWMLGFFLEKMVDRELTGLSDIVLGSLA